MSPRGSSLLNNLASHAVQHHSQLKQWLSGDFAPDARDKVSDVGWRSHDAWMLVICCAIPASVQPLVSLPDPTKVHMYAGEGASNVIPERVRMQGTIRALTRSHFARLRQRVTEVRSDVRSSV